jgi:hypothetical protein
MHWTLKRELKKEATNISEQVEFKKPLDLKHIELRVCDVSPP